MKILCPNLNIPNLRWDKNIIKEQCTVVVPSKQKWLGKVTWKQCKRYRDF